MNVKGQEELHDIKLELQRIINELDDISYGLKCNFSGIGSEICANSVLRVSAQYKAVLRKLNQIDTSKISEEFLLAQGNNGGAW